VQQVVGLLERLDAEVGLPVVLVGGAGDRAQERAILAGAGHPAPSLVGRTTLRELMGVLRRAAVHIAGDTGSSHLAAALGTPVVSVFGRTDPARLAPYGQGRWALHHPERCSLLCRCYHALAPVNRNNLCFRTPSACLAAIRPAEIAATVQRCLGEARFRGTAG
jgi:ADP-heptose:LPS heptosyltransferase